MARGRVVHRAVVAEEVVEAPARVETARVVERERVADMMREDLAAAEVGQAHPARTSATSSGAVECAPARRQAAAAAAAAKARCSASGAPGRRSRLAIHPPLQAAPPPPVLATAPRAAR